MRTLLTLDYEVYFGRNTGTVERSILEPTDALCAIARRHGAKLVFFVDAGFILKLRDEMHKSPRLVADHDAICRQVQALAAEGHEIQLHIHPHWEDSSWGEDGWRIDVSRFALQSFPQDQVDDIVRRYTHVLRELAGPEAAYAYRAGGWVIQPFERIRGALLANGVNIDSTVFAGGYREGQVQPYDFRGAPDKTRWCFDTDPLVEKKSGPFLEVPIASHRVLPDFFWRFAAAKKFGGARHRAFGDGRAIPMEGGDMLAKLLKPSTSVVSMDGYKSSFLAAAAADYRARRMEDFVVIGHPKALTPYSLGRLDEYLAGSGTGAVATSTFAPYRAALARRPAPRQRMAA